MYVWGFFSITNVNVIKDWVFTTSIDIYWSFDKKKNKEQIQKLKSDKGRGQLHITLYCEQDILYVNRYEANFSSEIFVKMNTICVQVTLYCTR